MHRASEAIHRLPGLRSDPLKMPSLLREDPDKQMPAQLPYYLPGRLHSRHRSLQPFSEHKLVPLPPRESVYLANPLGGGE